jgi:hypothetical protein
VAGRNFHSWAGPNAAVRNGVAELLRPWRRQSEGRLQRLAAAETRKRVRVRQIFAAVRCEPMHCALPLQVCLRFGLGESWQEDGLRVHDGQPQGGKRFLRHPLPAAGCVSDGTSSAHPGEEAGIPCWTVSSEAPTA